MPDEALVVRNNPAEGIAPEVLEIGWFNEDELPGVFDLGHVSRISEAFRVWRGGSAYFDR